MADDLTPSAIVRMALKAVPVTKIGLALSAIVILAAIARSSWSDVSLWVMLPVIAGTLLLMILLIIVSVIGASPGRLAAPAIILAWAVILAVIVMLGALVTAVLFGKPDRFAELILPERVADKPLLKISHSDKEGGSKLQPPSVPQAHNLKPASVPEAQEASTIGKGNTSGQSIDRSTDFLPPNDYQIVPDRADVQPTATRVTTSHTPIVAVADFVVRRTGGSQYDLAAYMARFITGLVRDKLTAHASSISQLDRNLLLTPFVDVSKPDFKPFKKYASYLITGYVTLLPDGQTTVGCYLFDVQKGSEVYRQGYQLPDGIDVSHRIGDRCSDDLVKSLNKRAALSRAKDGSLVTGRAAGQQGTATGLN